MSRARGKEYQVRQEHENDYGQVHSLDLADRCHCKSQDLLQHIHYRQESDEPFLALFADVEEPNLENKRVGNQQKPHVVGTNEVL